MQTHLLCWSSVYLQSALSSFICQGNRSIVFVFAINSSSSPCVCLSRCDNQRVKSLGLHCLLMWVFAITVWISDRMFCSFWLSNSFPYLHSLWHVLILFSSNQGITICAYLTIKQQNPHANLHLHFWPYEQWHWFTLPYLKFHDDDSLSGKATLEYIWLISELFSVALFRSIVAEAVHLWYNHVL